MRQGARRIPQELSKGIYGADVAEAIPGEVQLGQRFREFEWTE